VVQKASIRKSYYYCTANVYSSPAMRPQCARNAPAMRYENIRACACDVIREKVPFTMFDDELGSGYAMLRMHHYTWSVAESCCQEI
jgi:hypothetical protein